MHELIQFYIDSNISIIPVLKYVEGDEYRDGKRPFGSWQTYTKRLPTEEEIETWFSDDRYNVGVVTGKISNLVVVDCDDVDTYTSLVNTMPTLKKQLTAVTAKGLHIYFEPSVDLPSRTFTLNGNLHHIRQEGGYVVAPPSIHKTGHKYYFNDNSDTINLVKMDEFYSTVEVLGGFDLEKDRALRSIDWASELWEVTPEGSRNTRAAQLCGLLINKFRYDPGFIMGCMLSWNETACRPPMTKNEIETLVEREYQRYV